MAMVFYANADGELLTVEEVQRIYEIKYESKGNIEDYFTKVIVPIR